MGMNQKSVCIEITCDFALVLVLVKIDVVKNLLAMCVSMCLTQGREME